MQALPKGRRPVAEAPLLTDIDSPRDYHHRRGLQASLLCRLNRAASIAELLPGVLDATLAPSIARLNRGRP